MKLTSQVSLGMRGGTISYFVVNISKIRTKSNFNLFPFAIFAFHIFFDPTTIATQQFLPAKHFKINENEVLFHNLEGNMLFGRTSGKSEVLRATELYTALDVWLFFT
jgi:hypothetical protein